MFLVQQIVSERSRRRLWRVSPAVSASSGGTLPSRERRTNGGSRSQAESPAFGARSKKTEKNGSKRCRHGAEPRWASALVRSTWTTRAELVSRPRRCAHVRSSHRCEFMLSRRAIDCYATGELVSLDFFLTSPNSLSSRMQAGTALKLFVPKRLSATSSTGGRTRICAESAGTPAQQQHPTVHAVSLMYLLIFI